MIHARVSAQSYVYELGEKQLQESRQLAETAWRDQHCVGDGTLASGSGSLDITGLEPTNPFALALGLSSLGVHAWAHVYCVS